MNNQENEKKTEIVDEFKDGDENLVTDEAQKLGGGKGEGKGVEIGNFGDDDFMKTDQSIAQASPGKTANFQNQGGTE
ncbi:MAG: hypothetical protein M3T96_08590 [Acidobacteriota bacterium]|nr:hypothetical protein [Acidobacteriota bacterium]